MSSNKARKWSAASSLSKILTRISRTFSFSSKKSERTLKNSSKKIKPIETVTKKVNFAPQSAPILRRQAAQPISPFLLHEKSSKAMMYANMHVESDIEEDNYSPYSFQPDFSRFNISADNLYFQSGESYEHHCLDEIFHSTKIED